MTTHREKHPKGLYLLFFTELWERFGFYTVQTIIILYMTKGLLMPDEKANFLYAAFSSLMYLTPVIGGYLADRYLGFQRAVIFGGILFILAYSLAAFPGKHVFFLGLSLLICANGFFKPNVSCMVGELYKESDPRRDGGFTLFYMGINIGALIPPLIAGALVAKYGWHSGFILAAVGMAIGQIIFILGRKQLGEAGRYPKHRSNSFTSLTKLYLLLFIGTLGFIGLCQIALYFPEITNVVIEVSAIGVLFIVLFYLLKEPLAQRKKMLACLILIIISVAFWSLYNQAFTSLMLFADRNMAPSFLGIPLNAEATQFFNPFFIISLSPLLSRLWIRMDREGLNPEAQMKFSMGLLFTCSGYLLLAGATHLYSQDGIVSAGWLVFSYFLQTIGELLISPIGLAMVTVLCPKHLRGLMMGVWFFSQAASFAIGGMLANLAANPGKLSPVASLPIYTHAFFVFGVICLIVTLISFSLLPLLNRMTKASV